MRRTLSLILPIACLFAAFPAAGADKKDDDPYDSRRLTRLPVEAAVPDGVVSSSPAEAHPASLSSPIGPAEAREVAFSDAVERTTSEAPPATLRFHLQGEHLQDEATEPGPRGPGLAPGRSDGASAPPMEDSRIAALAPGDSVADFDGLASTGWIPPDTVMAVGSSHVVEPVNSGFAVYNKSGTQLQGYTTFSSFFSSVLPAGWGGFLFDPRIVYSAAQDRYVMLVLGFDSGAPDSRVFLAFSQTNDPTGSWWLYSFDHRSVPAADSDSWADYCGLGADDWGVYFTCNTFLLAGGFKYSKLWSLDTDGFSGGTIDGTVFWDLTWNSGSLAFSLQPALPHTTAADEATWFVNTFSGSGSSALLWKLTGDRTSSPTLTRATITVPTYNAIGGNVDQPGTAVDLDGGDARIMNAVYSSRRVFTVLTDDVDNDGDQAGWLTLKLDVDTNTLDWSHLLFTGDGFYYFYPAITMEGAVGGTSGNLAIFGSWTDAETSATGSTDFASALFKLYTNQPTDATGPFVSYEAGLDDYQVLDGSGRNRWGDYSGAGFDWATGHAWGAAEYAGVGNSWRTRIKGVEIAEDGCAGDAFEDDDTSGQASAITTDGTAQTHNICPVGDEDWVTFTISAESEVTVETSGPTGDTRLWLYDSTLTEVEFDDDDGAGLFSLIDRVCGVDPLPAGTYYAQVDEFGDDAEIGTYNLAVTATECPCVPDAFETDDSSGQASGIVSGAPQTHNICPVGDEDWVTFTLTEESGVDLETSGPGSDDTRMWLYDSGLNQVEFDDDDGTGLFSLIDRTCGIDPLPAGTYFAQVDEFGDNNEIETYDLAFAAAACCLDNLTLSNDTLTGTQSFSAGDTVTLGPNLIVNGTSIDVTAGLLVAIGDGTEIGGTFFSAGTDPALICP